jgi:Zn-dependent M28 family amino/carboxypeptidase
MAHHDAAPTGAIFDPGGQRKLAARYPELIQKRDVSAPFWWPAAAGPLFITLAAVLGSRVLNRLGTVLALLNTALGLDIARNRIVPGANDNLSAVAALVALAERLRDRPVSGVRVVLASCGAEEVLQGGVYGFVDRHLRPLDPDRTWVLNLDSIGSPELIMVEGEGPFVMHRFDAAFADRVATVCESATGAPLRRGILARASSDSIIPSRAGYPTAMLASWEPDTKLISNYHLMSDTPENLVYGTIERAVDVAEALARDLSSR